MKILFALFILPGIVELYVSVSMLCVKTLRLAHRMTEVTAEIVRFLGKLGVMENNSTSALIMSGEAKLLYVFQK